MAAAGPRSQSGTGAEPARWYCRAPCGGESLGGCSVAAIVAATLVLRAGGQREGRDDHLLRRHQDRRPLVPRQGRRRGAPAPTILEGPGWSQPGETAARAAPPGRARSSACRASSNFIDHGYNVLTWDPRGFGQSGGTVADRRPALRGTRRPGADRLGREAAGGAARPELHASKKKRKRHAKRRRRAKSQVTCATSPNDPTIGMAGASYGGGIQLVSAALDKRIDAIAPTIAWHSLLTSLFPDGNIKLGWGSLLSAVGRRGEPAGRPDRARPPPPAARTRTSIPSSPTGWRAERRPRRTSTGWPRTGPANW